MRVRTGLAGRAACGAALLLAAALAPALPAARAEDPEVVDLDAEPGSRWLGERFYGVFRGDARVGWLRRDLARVTWGERDAVQRTVETFVSLAGAGNAQHTVERAVYLVDAPQHLVEIERRVESQARVSWRRAVRREGRFDIVTVRDGEETEGAVTAIDLFLADELVAERTVAAAAEREEGPVGAQGAAVALDLIRMRPIKRIVAVRGTEESDEGSTLYLVSVATGPDTWSDPVAVDGDGAIVRGGIGDDLTIRRMPKDEAQAELGLSSVEVADRVPMDARLGDVLTIREMEISMPAPPEGAPAPFPATGRQIHERFEGRLHLRIHVDRDAGEVTGADREAALRPERGIDCDDAAVVDAADRVLRGTSRPGVRVTRLLEFTARHLDDGVVVSEPSASELLRSRRGDCTEHVRLFVALARAANIPAREVTGLVWLDDEQRTFAWHAWAEVELSGRWRPVDPTAGRSPAHAAHVRVDPAARAAGVFRDVRFRLHDVVR